MMISFNDHNIIKRNITIYIKLSTFIAFDLLDTAVLIHLGSGNNYYLRTLHFLNWFTVSSRAIAELKLIEARIENPEVYKVLETIPNRGISYVEMSKFVVSYVSYDLDLYF